MSLIAVSPPTDPITAGFESLTACFQFLTSPAGQMLIVSGDEAFKSIVDDIIRIFHDKHANTPPNPNSPVKVILSK